MEILAAKAWEATNEGLFLACFRFGRILEGKYSGREEIKFN